METPFYSEQQRQYWVKRPANKSNRQYWTVEFQHPDFGFVRLVRNDINKEFDVDGTIQEFTAVVMEVPKVTNQETDSTKAGTIIFGRIGVEFRKKLLMITPLGAITSPITAKLRQYQKDLVLPVYERRLYVGKDGISMTDENVNIRLSIDNPAKLTQELQFYDPSMWVGLRAI